MSWNASRRLLVTIGCAWLGVPVVMRLWSPAESLQWLAATPLYELFALMQVVLLACTVGAFQRRPWVANVLLGCAVGWTVAAVAWVVLSPLGLMSLLMSMAPSGIAGSSTSLNAAAAAPMRYAGAAMIELWILALVAMPLSSRGRVLQAAEAAAGAGAPARWQNRVAWAGIIVAALHVTVWPAVRHGAFFGALFGSPASAMQVELTPAQRQALSEADQKTMVELNEDLARIARHEPPVHAATKEYRNSTWYETRRYAITAFRFEGRVRQVNVLFYSGDLARVVPEPKFFVDWPYPGAASAPSAHAS